MERRAKVNAISALAKRSGQMISMDPDRYGEHMLDGLESELQQFLAQLPEEVREHYEDAYIAKYSEWLGCMSRCFSQMITGAGGWKASTFRRWERNNNAEHAARERLDAWAKKVIKRCNREERLTGWAEVERLQDKIDSLKAAQETMKAANKVVRNSKLSEVEKVDELVALGFSEQNAMKVLEPDFCGRVGFPSYMLTNNLAKIKDAEARMARHAAMAQEEDREETFEWGVLAWVYSEERVRFVFDGKPSAEVISLMKSNAFKWSPRNKAWQRQITPSSKYAVKRMIEQLNTIAA
jgi:hypothetical protein